MIRLRYVTCEFSFGQEMLLNSSISTIESALTQKVGRGPPNLLLCSEAFIYILHIANANFRKLYFQNDFKLLFHDKVQKHRCFITKEFCKG